MATRITQRLITAGASPERAAAFEKQFIAARPSLKPQDIQDAFDLELGAYAAAQFPNMWRPQTNLTDADLPNYIIGTYGQQKYNDIVSKASPAFNKAKQSSNLAIQTIVKDIEDGVPLADAIVGVRTAWKDAANRVAVFGNLTEQDAVNQVNSLYADYGKQTNAAKTFLSNDKYYKANLPHPNLKYGTTTNLTQGTIDFKTNPQAETVRSKVLGAVGKMQQQLPQGFRPGSITADAAERMAIQQGRQISQQPIDDAIFKSLSSSKATPFFVEVKVRENLKGKTTLP